MSGEIKLRGTEWDGYAEDIPLTERQKLFVEQYAKNGFNARAAAKAAGYKLKFQGAYRLINDPKIKAAIRARFQDHLMEADEVLARLASQARGDVGDYIDDEGNVDFKKLKEDGKSHLVESISDSKYGKRVQFYSTQKALALIGKYHRLFAERIENISFDMNRLSDRQLERLSSGDKLIDVLLDREEYDDSITIDGESQIVEEGK